MLNAVDLGVINTDHHGNFSIKILSKGERGNEVNPI